MILITRLTRREWLAGEYTREQPRAWWGYWDGGDGWVSVGVMGLEVTVTW